MVAALRPQTHGAKKHQNGFDSIRILLAILVIFSHSFPLTEGSNAHEPLARIAAPPMLPLDEVTFGSIAVWGFFILSGYLITQSWNRSSSPWSYLAKRIRRIYPGFLVAAAACVLLEIWLAEPGTPRVPSLVDFLFSSIRLQLFSSSSLFSSNPVPYAINGSLWSIPFEFLCYLGVMVLGLAGLLKDLRWLAVLIIATTALHAFVDFNHWQPGGMLLGRIFGFPLAWLRILPFFLAGMFFAVAGDRIKFVASYAVVSAVLVVIATPLPFVPYCVYPVFGSYLLMYLCFNPVVSKLQLGRWGDFSYGTYLYAFPIQQTIVHFAKGNLTPLGLFAVATPLSVGAGVLSWFIVERRFLVKRAS